MVNRIELLVHRINEELKERNMSVMDLVRQSGVNKSTVYNLMAGHRGIEPEGLKAIGYVLDIPASDLAYYIELSDVAPTDRVTQREIFSQEWDKASPERRREMLEFLKLMNRLDGGRKH